MDNQHPSINNELFYQRPKEGYGFIYKYTSPSGKSYIRQTITSLKDREIRKYISEIRLEHTIISLSSGKGYRKARFTDKMTKEEIAHEIIIMKKAINENNSRIKNIKKVMRSQIAYLKILEREA